MYYAVGCVIFARLQDSHKTGLSCCYVEGAAPVTFLAHLFTVLVNDLLPAIGLVMQVELINHPLCIHSADARTPGDVIGSVAT